MTDGSEAYWVDGRRYVIYRGCTMLLQDAVRATGSVVTPETAWMRIVRHRYPVDLALTKPVTPSPSHVIGDPNTPPRVGRNIPRPWVTGARLKLGGGEIIDCWVTTDANGFHTFGPIGQP